MKKIFFYACLFISVWGVNSMAFGQQYRTVKGEGSFSVSAPAKTIDARSEQVTINIDAAKASLRLSVPVSSFGFSNNFVSDSLNEVIHERFNSYYMESGKYPNITYNGTVDNISDINFEKDGNYLIRTQGILRIHGVDREVTAEGSVRVKAGEVSVSARIKVLPTDYGIRIPAYIGHMYFREVFIKIKAQLQLK